MFDWKVRAMASGTVCRFLPYFERFAEATKNSAEYPNTSFQHGSFLHFSWNFKICFHVLRCCAIGVQAFQLLILCSLASCVLPVDIMICSKALKAEVIFFRDVLHRIVFFVSLLGKYPLFGAIFFTIKYHCWCNCYIPDGFRSWWFKSFLDTYSNIYVERCIRAVSIWYCLRPECSIFPCGDLVHFNAFDFKVLSKGGMKLTRRATFQFYRLLAKRSNQRPHQHTAVLDHQYFLRKLGKHFGCLDTTVMELRDMKLFLNTTETFSHASVSDLFIQ